MQTSAIRIINHSLQPQNSVYQGYRLCGYLGGLGRVNSGSGMKVGQACHTILLLRRRLLAARTLRVHVSNNWVLRALVIGVVAQVLENNLIIRYLDS